MGDPVVEAASEVVGGPRGRYAASRVVPWTLTAGTLVALAAIPVGIAASLRVPCLRSAWRGDEQFWHACYSDLPGAYRDPSVRSGLQGLLSQGDVPSPGQPPLTTLLTSTIADLVPSGLTEGGEVRWYFALWAFVIVVLFLLTVALVAATARNPWTAAHVALSPVAALTLFVSADIAGVALATAGIWAWGRRRPALAGVLLGLAVTARTYPLLVLAAIGLLALRAGAGRSFGRTVLAAAVTTGVVMGGLALLNPGAAVAAYRAWWSATAGYGSPWILPQLAGSPLPPTVVTLLAVVGWVVALGLGVVLALSSHRRPTIAEVSLVMVAVVLVTGKSFTVQSSLWLLPLVALAALPWRDHLVWAGAEAVNFVAVWLAIAATSVPDRGLPDGWYAVALVLRVCAVGWLATSVWLRARRRPAVTGEGDGQAVEVDDAAGVMTGARDRVLVRFA